MRLDHPEGRKGWSLLAIAGAGMVFTLFAAYAMWALQGQAHYTFWLGVLAHGQVFMVIGAYGWILGRRVVISITRDGISKDDSGEED